MSLFANKNQGDLQSTPTPALYADIPNDNLRPWWTQVRRVLTQQLYDIQNHGIFESPVLRKPEIIGGTFTNDETGQVRIAKSTFSTLGADVAFEMGLFRTEAGYTYIDFHSKSPVDSDYEGRIVRNPGVNGEFALIQRGVGDLALITDTGYIRLGVSWTAITTQVLDGFVTMKDGAGVFRKFATVS